MAETEKTNAAVSKFARMTVEELEEAIRVYLQADALDENMDDLLLAADELQRRKEALGDHIDTDAHWERFKRDYLPLLDEADEEGDAEEEYDHAITPAEMGPETRGHSKHILLRVFRTVAAAALITLILGMTACAFIPQVRASVVRFVVRTFGNHSVVSMEPEDTEPAVSEPSGKTEIYELAGFTFEVPEEFELDSTTITGNRARCLLLSDDASITVNIISSEENKYVLDTEDVDAKAVKIGDVEGLLVPQGENLSLSWGLPNDSVMVYLLGNNTNEQTLLKIANSFAPVG